METNLVVAIFVGIVIAVFISTATIFFIFRQRYRNLAKQIDEQEIISRQIVDLTEAPVESQSAVFSPAKPYSISLWGPKGAGKTTYITMIYGASLMSDTKWFVTPNDIESTRFIQDFFNGLLKGFFPTPTMTVQEPNIYSFRFKRKSHAIRQTTKNFFEFITSFLGSKFRAPKNLHQAETIISFADVAGEQYMTEAVDHPLWEHLATSDGIVCLLDPSEGEDQFNITFQLLQFLWLKLKDRRNGLVNGMLPQRVAFCFTKIDRPEYVQFATEPQKLLQMLESKLNLDIDKLLHQYAPSVKYFAVSSIGLNCEIENFQITNPQKISPFNVLEPVLWIIGKDG